MLSNSRRHNVFWSLEGLYAMKNRLFALAVVMSTALGFASTASAADTYVAVTMGSTTVDSNSSPLDPKGSVVQVTAGDDLFTVDRFTVSAEIAGSYGNAEASRTTPSCDVLNCGYDETRTQTDSSRWTVSAGVRISHPFGPVTVLLGGGFIAADYRERDRYDSGGVFPTFTWQREGYGVGTYVDVAVAYPLTDSWALVGDYKKSSMTSQKWSGGWSEQFDATTWSVGGVYTFGGK